MADIDALVEKWFIDTSGSKPLLDLPASERGKHWFPPQTRHAGANLSDHTKGNKVVPLVDAEEQFPVWHDTVKALTNDPDDVQLLHSGWIMSDCFLKTGGKSVKPRLEALLKETDEVYVAVSDHWTNATQNRSFTGGFDEKTFAVDSRYPDLGSNHMKYTVFKDGTDDWAIVSSADFWNVAVAMRSHDGQGPDAQHEFGAKLFGPAVGDVERSFANRWNDETRDDTKGSLWHPVERHGFTSGVTTFLEGYDVWTGETPPKLSLNGLQTSTTGPHAVQVLQTFGIDYDDETYSWANGSGGEFTAWAARLRALSKATDYIYVEDQYFVPFGVPGTATYELAMAEDHKWAPFTILRERLRDGVDVFVVTNDEPDGRFADTAAYAREEGLVALRDAAEESGSGDLTIATLEVAGEAINTHAKLLLCDDEYAAFGSANFNRRSMANDGEMLLGVVDADEKLVREIRTNVWGEHLEESRTSLTGLAGAKSTFKTHVANGTGRVRELPIPDEATGEPLNQKFGLSKWDHYAGPTDRTPPGGSQ